MVKAKKNKSSDIVHNKKMQKTLNPFEIHVNKIKMQVIGKRDKNDRGLPGVARAKAIQKRKQTLLQERKVINKSNKFIDKRIGEHNHSMTLDDKNMARFAAVRIKTHKRKSIFNLADDEVLTHRGQTLSEIEKFDDPRSDDDDDFEEKSGNLDKEFVEDAHFGGGILRKTGNEGAKTHKELIDQLIAESKKRKAEKQKTKEATLELTEKLDTEWKDLMPLVNKSKKTDDDGDPKPKIDEYDKVMRELRFEARGTVSDRLKSEDEVAKEEKEKLEQLENERLQRMKGIVDDKVSKTTHRSADDLDDDFVYESDPEYMLSYNTEGQSNVTVDALLNGKSIKQNDMDIQTNVNEENDEGSEDVSDAEQGDEDDSDAESEDNFSDLKQSDSESDDSADEPQVKGKKLNIVKDPDVPKLNDKQAQSELKEKSQENIKQDLIQRKEVMEKARKELPYTFSLPDSYESLQQVLQNQPSTYQGVIIERMIKCNHPSLAASNKEGLSLLFVYLLQHLNDVAAEATDVDSIKNCFEIFRALAPQIYALAAFNEENAHKSLVEVMKEKHEEYKLRPKRYPGLELLIFLRLVGILFSTSDYRHQVVTPCFIFIEQMLFKCKVQTKKDISYGLFLCTLVLEFTSLSKRYMPSAISFLGGIFHMCIPKLVKLIKIAPPFKSSSTDLVLVENHSKNDTILLKLDSKDLLGEEITDEYRIQVLYTALRLTEEFINNLKGLPSCVEMFDIVQSFIEQIPATNYPARVNQQRDKILTMLTRMKSERTLKYIVAAAKKPKALRLYEPKIEEVYDRKKFKVQSREKAERDKLLHKLKREKKGALREIRRDKSFLSRVQIQQKIQSDQERKDKVKRIYSEAALQQSELKALDRKKKRK